MKQTPAVRDESLTTANNPANHAVRMTLLCAAVSLLAVTIKSGVATAQTTDYTIDLISAWNTAKTYGFQFHPVAQTGETLTQPRDGYNTRLTRPHSYLPTKTTGVAQVVGGNPSVNAGERNVVFRMYSGKTLQPGWTVQALDINGNFTYVQQPRLGTNDMSYQVRLAPGGLATIRRIVLRGPPGAKWQDAFSAPERREYLIEGIGAWTTAKQYGFQFRPRYDDRISSPYDGVQTVHWTTASFGAYRCVTRPGRLPGDGTCMHSQVVGGIMLVYPDPYVYNTSLTARFAMYEGKRLAPGWKLKRIEVSGGTWIRRPTADSDDLSFVLELTAYSDPASAFVRTIVLEGPSNAASWQDAFKGAVNP